MKNIFKILLLFSLAVFTSCEEDLNINTDPNSPAEINAGLALASAQASLITVVGGDLTNIGGFYAQYHTQAPNASQYEIIDQYNITTSYADRLWTELYAGCLNDLKYVEDKSTQDGETGTFLIATVLKAYTFQLLGDLFGDIPYTEALQGESNITPHATPGNEMYLDLIAKIDAAVAAYNANPVASSVGKQDQIYQANMVNWIKFANTLKLKLYMRMSYTSSANPTAVTALVAQNNFITSDAKFANFGTSLNQRNPFFEVQITFLGDVNNVASNSLQSFFVENEDPRITAVYRYRASDSTYVSLPQGAGPALTNLASTLSRPNINETTPVFLMTVAESNFLQAEGLIRYAGGTGAKEKYDQGVIASFDTYKTNFKILDADKEEATASAIVLATPFISAGGVYEYKTAATIEQTVRQVIIQKWASLAYVNDIESYIETTRTKFPEVVTEGTENYTIGNRIPSRISVFSGNTVPSIFFYPDDETTRNPNLTQHTSLTNKVWWDQKN